MHLNVFYNTFSAHKLRFRNTQKSRLRSHDSPSFSFTWLLLARVSALRLPSEYSEEALPPGLLLPGLGGLLLLAFDRGQLIVPRVELLALLPAAALLHEVAQQLHRLVRRLAVVKRVARELALGRAPVVLLAAAADEVAHVDHAAHENGHVARHAPLHPQRVELAAGHAHSDRAQAHSRQQRAALGQVRLDDVALGGARLADALDVLRPAVGEDAVTGELLRDVLDVQRLGHPSAVQRKAGCRVCGGLVRSDTNV